MCRSEGGHLKHVLRSKVSSLGVPVNRGHVKRLVKHGYRI